MARNIQQIEIDGQAVWVEVEDVVISPPARQGDNRFANTSSGGASDVVAKAVEKVDLSTTLKAVIGPVQKALSVFKPDELNVELTLGFKADVGVFIASGEANAQVKVSAKWKPSAA